MSSPRDSSTNEDQILIVDDNTTNLGILRELLKKSGRRILAATSGRQALHIASQALPDLILLDIMMPEMDGFAVMQVLRSDDRTADIPVIFVSALSQTEDIVRGLRAGAADYVSKPFNAEEVDVRVSAQLMLRRHDRELAQEKKQLELLHEQILGAMLDGVIGFNIDGNITFSNDASLRLLGIPDGEELSGQRIQDALGIEHIGQCSFNDIVAFPPQGHALSTWFVRRDAVSFPVECTLQPVDNDGEILHWVLVFRDISERIKAEQQLKSSHEELLSAHHSLEQAQMKLIQAAKMESIGRLAAGVAHETKNPLAIIQLGADFLADVVGDDETRQAVLNDIREAVRRADKVVKGLLDFSRESEFKTRPVAVSELLDEALILVGHEMRQHNIALSTEYDADMPELCVDKDKLTQVFINLFMNAIQSMKRDGQLQVTACVACPCDAELVAVPDELELDVVTPVVQIRIRDSGPGISSENLKKLFDPFFTTKPTGQGTGLGLSVSQNIVKLHGGWLTLGNRADGGGAEAVLLFPVRDCE